MKKNIIFFVALIFISLSSPCLAQNDNWPILKGPYLGQKPPGGTPEIFSPGIISFGFHELRITFSPQGDEAFYVTMNSSYRYRILVNVRSEHGKWNEPQLMPFAWEHNNGGPSFSPDGHRVYFASNRDSPHIIHDGSGFDIWYIDKKGSGWTDPIKMPDAINSHLGETGPSVSANGNLYFDVTDESQKTFIYCSRFKEGKYQPRQRIKIDLKSDVSISSSYIAPDESYLLVQGNMPGGIGRNDLYVSFSNRDGSWRAPTNLGDGINTEFSEIGPRVSLDGKYLFFTSYRGYPAQELEGAGYRELINLLKGPKNGYGTLFWVDAGIIEKLRPTLLTQCSREQPETVTDIDGNVYRTVKIGGQVWMAENLKAIHYRDGTPIPRVQSNDIWCRLTKGAYCLYQNHPVSYKKTYGALYNFHAVTDPRGLSPEGWHVPTAEEWMELIELLGGVKKAGRIMKETGSGLWKITSSESFNESGFSALPAGGRGQFGGVGEVGYYATWWSSTSSDSIYAWHWGLYPDKNSIRYNPGHKASGFSVRCIKNKR